MSVDVVNYALTDVSRRIRNADDNSFSDNGRRLLLDICSVMRSLLMDEDVAGFERYVDNILSCQPDAADFLIEELFNELGIYERSELTKLINVH